MKKEPPSNRIDKYDERFTESLLEAKFRDESERQRIQSVVDAALDDIPGDRHTDFDPKGETPDAVPFSAINRRFLIASTVTGLAASIAAAIGLTFFVFGNGNSAQAAVQDALAKLLESGPRKYDAVFTYVGPVLGEFRSEGNCFLDGSNRFVFQIPSPFGVPSRLWTLGSDGEQLWAILPSGHTWSDQKDQLQDWWESRGLGDIPILHVEAILVSFGETYALEDISNSDGKRTIFGTATENSPPRWPDEIEMTIDSGSGFADEIHLRWNDGRLRQIRLFRVKDFEVPGDFFELKSHQSTN